MSQGSQDSAQADNTADSRKQPLSDHNKISWRVALSIESAALAGIKPDATMFAALYGELVVHPWREPFIASSDLYSLFYARSLAMGWLTEATTETSLCGYWGMNDAGQGLVSNSQPPCIAWFQVTLTGTSGRSLPVQPFLRCAGDVVARIGTLRLEAVQVLLPVQYLHKPSEAFLPMDAVAELLSGANWFADCDPRLRTRVEVMLDGGQEPSIRSVAPEIFRWMQQIRQDVFLCDAFSLDDSGMILKPALTDELWCGPPQHRATFRGTLVEWSLDALGWLAAFLADAGSRHGLSTPLLLVAGRPKT